MSRKSSYIRWRKIPQDGLLRDYSYIGLKYWFSDVWTYLQPNSSIFHESISNEFLTSRVHERKELFKGVVRSCGCVHTGLCSKGTSTSSPGSQLGLGNPLVPPSISSFTAFALILWGSFCALWYPITHESKLLIPVLANGCLGPGTREQYKFSLSIYIYSPRSWAGIGAGNLVKMEEERVKKATVRFS